MALEGDQLAALLAQGDNVVMFGAAETSSESDKRLGQRIFHEAVKEISGKLCSDRRIVTLMERENNFDEVTLITTVLDIVLTSIGGVPVLVLTAMIIKYGLKRVCAPAATQ